MILTSEPVLQVLLTVSLVTSDSVPWDFAFRVIHVDLVRVLRIFTSALLNSTGFMQAAEENIYI